MSPNASYVVGPVRAARGTKTSGWLDVAPGTDGATRIPVTVVHGGKPGPVLALIAGTHGSEYPPILALQRVRAKLAPDAVAGTIILVHIANLPSFHGRTVYYGPADGKNLNRVYPGSANGTQSERIAHVITTEVIARADYVADLHCGDANEALRAYSYWMRSGRADVDVASRGMAEAFGIDHIVIDDERPRDPAASVFTSNTAITRGKPAITTETGELGGVEERWIAMAEAGVWNLLRHLGMIEGTPVVTPPTTWLAPTRVLRSPATGLFRAVVRPDDEVSAGDVIGTLHDHFGDPIGEVRAPFGGIVVYVVATPPISSGEPIAMIGTKAKAPD